MWAETGAESTGRETNAGVSDILVRDVILDGAPSGLRIKSDASRGGPVPGCGTRVSACAAIDGRSTSTHIMMPG